jgi:hypothetical protein
MGARESGHRKTGQYKIWSKNWSWIVIFLPQSTFMKNRTSSSNKVIENLEKREKKDSALRAAVARNVARQNAPSAIEQAIGVKLVEKKRPSAH